MIEKSNILCQIVDCRSPLSYICDDVIKICNEEGKHHILVLNKADFLSSNQFHEWRKYFESKGIKFFMWSNRNDKNDSEKFIENISNCLEGISLFFFCKFICLKSSEKNWELVTTFK